MRVLKGKEAKCAVQRLERRQLQGATPEVQSTVAKIVRDVRSQGDRSLRRYAKRLDGMQDREPLCVSQREIEGALSRISPDLRRALEAAARCIQRFCERQKPRAFMSRMGRGLKVGQVLRPLEAVGCYVPSGRYPLPSSLLMTAIPAQVAGVPRIVVASPHPADATLAAAALLGIVEFYRVGGAQAIAALAYGTESMPAVVKIVGPGNAYVTAAKRLVAFDCAIDMLAGPTEVLIVANEGKPEFIAADLVAQAEHDPDALPILITTSAVLANAVAAEVMRTANGNANARAAIRNGCVLIAKTRNEATDWANRIAAEHITVPAELVPEICSAGSMFVGDYSPQAMGDYASGPNHVLPTGGAARYRGGLSVNDFLKVITVQQASAEGLRRMSKTVTTLAQAEGLAAHAASVRVRCAHA